jgi:DNA-binding NarL/FixJ family response regulator
MKLARILIAEDHSLFAEALANSLRPSGLFEVMGIATTGADTLLLLHRQAPIHLLLLDLNLPNGDGISLLPRIVRENPATKVLVVSSYQNESMVQEVRKSGAHGYVHKSTPLDTLLSVCQRVLAGEGYYQSFETVAEPLNPHFFDPFGAKYQLTRKEVQVMQCVARGLSSKEIATELGMSEHTASTHRRNLMQKVRAHNSADVTRIAQELGVG